MQLKFLVHLVVCTIFIHPSIQALSDQLTEIYNTAHELKDFSKFHEALELYQIVVDQEPQYAFGQLGLAQTHLALGNFERGWPGLVHRHPDIASFTHYDFKNMDLWQHTILIRCEWGFGDIFQFIRYAQFLKQRGARVLLQCYQELVPLLSLCPYIDQVIAVGETFPPHTIQIPLLSLPECCGTTVETIPTTIPYIFTDLSLKKMWKATLAHDKNYKIGICWSGRGDPKAPAHVQKNIPLQELARITELENISVYSLQFDAHLSDYPLIKTFDENFDKNHGRFMDTAAVMQSLDLIITLDSSLAHLAGSLNAPVWVLLPYTADWRWMSQRTDSPWYPSMRLFRQEIPGNWSLVIDHIIKELTDLTQDPINLFKQARNYLTLHDLERAETLYNMALEKMPLSLGTIHNLAYTVRWQGKLDEAIALYKQEIELIEKKVDGYFGLAQAYLLGGNFKDGLPALELGRQNIISEVPQRLKSLDNIKGKTVLILAEWGFGDAFQFVRYAKLLKEAGATVMVQTYEELKQIMKCCPYIDYIITPDDNVACEPDARIPLLSLPYLFDTTLATIPAEIPYFYAPKHLIDLWRATLIDNNSSKLRIGICWHGSTTDAFPNKNIPLLDFEPLLRIPGITFVSLQKIHGTQEYAQLPANIILHDLGADFDTINGRFMDTAAIMMHLDLVITVDTSIAHLAGALGVPVWVALPHVPDWRWMLEREDTPWYPTMTLFRQKTAGNWHTVIKEMVQALQKIL